MEDGRSNPEAGTATDGTGLAGPPDAEHIDAWALDASLHYSVNVITHPNLSIEYAFGTGDSDRSAKVVSTTPGNKEGTTDRNFLYFGYIDTGLGLSPRLANLQMFKFGLSMTPSEFVKKKLKELGFYGQQALKKEENELRRQKEMYKSNIECRKKIGWKQIN